MENADVYRSPANSVSSVRNKGKTNHFAIHSPESKDAASVGIQTEMSLAVPMHKITWKPVAVDHVDKVEPEIVGEDAKIGLAVKAQARDVLPEREASSNVVGNVEDEADKSDGTDVDCAVDGGGCDDVEAVEVERIESHKERLPPKARTGLRKKRIMMTRTSVVRKARSSNAQIAESTIVETTEPAEGEVDTNSDVPLTPLDAEVLKEKSGLGGRPPPLTSQPKTKPAHKPKVRLVGGWGCNCNDAECRELSTADVSRWTPVPITT